MENANEFNSIILSLQDKLFRFALSILKDTEDAEDALQEILVKLWERRNELFKYDNIEAFLMKMTKNQCFDKLRKMRKFDSLDNNTLKASSFNIQNEIELKNIADIARHLIDQLPTIQRAVIKLRDVEEFEMDEIAEIMEMNNSAVRTNLSRARKTVREQLIKIQALHNPNNRF